MILVALLPFLGLADGAPGLFRSLSKSRQVECERMSVEEAARRFPGRVSQARPRGDYVDRSVLICAERLLAGLRDPAEEAILRSLHERTAALAQTAAGLRPDLAERTWLVEAFHGSGAVSSKIAFATKDALIQEGLMVSDRRPGLAAGDVDVITRMPPFEAYPSACRRYFDGGSLSDEDALLAVIHLDPRETALHAGLCVDGRWTWLR